MSFHQKRKNKPIDEIKAGGTDYVPPALCLRAAHVSACVSAHVEGTEKAGRRSTFHVRCVRPWAGNHPILTWEAA
jgi:hypothetical protein